MNDLEQSAANAEKLLGLNVMPGKQVLETLVWNRVTYRSFREWMERAYLLEVDRQSKGNHSEGARIAGVHRNTYSRLLETHHVSTRHERARERREKRARDLGLRG